MRKMFVGLTASAALIVAMSAAQASPPVRSSSAVVASGATLAISQGVQSGQSSGTNHFGGPHHVNWAQVGLALGLTGTALAAFIILHNRSSSPR
jgi:hypothetical protein